MAERRFWSKVSKGNGCWLWNGHRHKDGYGRFMVSRSIGVKNAHRLSWEYTFGEIPEGMCVLHQCDNPPCVNPKHLFLGTQADNMRDMMKKKRGRYKKGLLPADVVKSIREDYKPYVFTNRMIAEKYGITKDVSICITQNKNYVWVK